MPPHVIMGYSLTEWLALFSLFSIFLGTLAWFVNVVIFKPLRSDIKDLSGEFKDLSNEFKSFKEETKDENHTNSELLVDHEKRLIRVEDKVGMKP